jgi:hypothetical protein
MTKRPNFPLIDVPDDFDFTIEKTTKLQLVIYIPVDGTVVDDTYGNLATAEFQSICMHGTA